MKMEMSGTSDVRCTVAIPVYNRPELVRRALDSALRQTVEGLEILVVDNCSTDTTWQVLQTYREEPRVRLVRNERNLGLFGNFNRCLALARGEYLRFLCSDDRLAPDCLRAEVATMQANPDVSLLTTPARHVDEDGRFLRLYASEMPPAVYDGRQAVYAAFWLQVYYGKNPLNCPSGVLMRSSVARLIGEFDGSMSLAGDLEYYCRLLRHGNLAVLDRVGCEMMIHRAQTSIHSGYNDIGVAEFQRLIKENADILEEYGEVRAIQRQTIALLYWQQLQAWSIGVRAARSFGQQRRRSPGFHRGHAMIDLVRMALRRANVKRTGRWPLPIKPLRTLDVLPASELAA